MPDPDLARSVRAATEMLDLGQHSVLALIKSGALVASDVSLTPGGKPRWRILQSDIDEFLARRRHQPPAPRRRRRRKAAATIKEYF